MTQANLDALRNKAVEDALFLKATGQQYQQQEAYKLKRVSYDENGKKVEDEYVQIVTVEKQTMPDFSAISLWLKTQQPHRWGDAPATKQLPAVHIIDDIPACPAQNAACFSSEAECGQTGCGNGEFCASGLRGDTSGNTGTVTDEQTQHAQGDAGGDVRNEAGVTGDGSVVVCGGGEKQADLGEAAAQTGAVLPGGNSTATKQRGARKRVAQGDTLELSKDVALRESDLTEKRGRGRGTKTRSAEQEGEGGAVEGLGGARGLQAAGGTAGGAAGGAAGSAAGGAVGSAAGGAADGTAGGAADGAPGGAPGGAADGTADGTAGDLCTKTAGEGELCGAEISGVTMHDKRAAARTQRRQERGAKNKDSLL